MDVQKIDSYRFKNIITPKSNQNFLDIEVNVLNTKEVNSECKDIATNQDEKRFMSSQFYCSENSGKEESEEEEGTEEQMIDIGITPTAINENDLGPGTNFGHI